MTDRRLPIFPTRMNLKLTENKQKSALKGYSLLKRKSDALKQRYRVIQQEYTEKVHAITEKFRNAFFSLTEAEFLGANSKAFIYECQKHPVSIKTNVEMVSGVNLPSFELVKFDTHEILFLDKAGQALNKCRSMFIDVLNRLVELAALKNSFIVLEKVLMATNRRVNALEFNIIPHLENTVGYINSELDEQDREDFFRLKKIQNLKK